MHLFPIHALCWMSDMVALGLTYTLGGGEQTKEEDHQGPLGRPVWSGGPRNHTLDMWILLASQHLRDVGS